MAHFAKISETNQVLSVLTLNNSDMLNVDGVEDESVGQQYLEQHNNWPSHLWIQTSYNTVNNEHKLGGTPLRGNYGGMGYTWDADNEIFWPPQPYSSWVKNLTTAIWNAPITEPSLTEEQETQNTTPNYMWQYIWDETAYQLDNTTGWVLRDSLQGTNQTPAE